MLAEAGARAKASGPRLVAGVALVALALVAGVAVLVLRGRSGNQTSAAKLPPLPPLQYAATLVKGDVVQTTADSVTITTAGGTRTLTVGPSTRVETLRPAKPAAIAPGDYVTVGGVANLVNSFAIKQVVIIPAAEVGAPGPGAPRTKAGFNGWDAYTAAEPAPAVYGKVDALVEGGVRLSGPTGVFTLALDDQSPLFRVTVGGSDLIRGGDHLAFTETSGAPAVLFAVPGEQSSPAPPPRPARAASPTPAAP